MSDMQPEEFRRAGREVIDWIADYLASVGERPVLPATMKPGDLIDRLPAAAPLQGEAIEDILKDFDSKVMPAMNHWNHPRFHGFFSISASAPGILAETLTAALNVNAMLWKASPAATELEEVVLSWLRQWMGLPENFFGIIYDTASISTLHSLVSSRAYADPESGTRGSFPKLTQ